MIISLRIFILLIFAIASVKMVVEANKPIDKTNGASTIGWLLIAIAAGVFTILL